ncbi:MAG: hypothetical protein J0H69_19440 [Burkholderiales bacterium]|nr:hypothetical protein [Burkholderiales bacterium]
MPLRLPRFIFSVVRVNHRCVIEAMLASDTKGSIQRLQAMFEHLRTPLGTVLPSITCLQKAFIMLMSLSDKQVPIR